MFHSLCFVQKKSKKFVLGNVLVVVATFLQLNELLQLGYLDQGIKNRCISQDIITKFVSVKSIGCVKTRILLKMA